MRGALFLFMCGLIGDATSRRGWTIGSWEEWALCGAGAALWLGTFLPVIDLERAASRQRAEPPAGRHS